MSLRLTPLVPDDEPKATPLEGGGSSAELTEQYPTEAIAQIRRVLEEGKGEEVVTFASRGERITWVRATLERLRYE